MTDESDNELKSIDRQIRKINLIGAPGAILLGIGLYGLIVENAANLHSLLGHQPFVLLLLISGALIEIWQLSKLLPLFKQRNLIDKDSEA